MSKYPLLSDEEVEAMPVFNSLQEALEDPENAYTMELMGEVFGADEFEDAIAQLPRIQIMVIDGNDQFDRIPAAIGTLKNLQYLEVRDCPLNSVADELGNCAELSGLVLSNVRPLAELPASLGKLSNLDYVEISATEISNLPDTYSNWKALSELNLVNNRIHELPRAIAGMESLINLRTYGNYAMYVDAFIKDLRNLTAFDHGMIQFRGTTEEEVKAALPELVMTQVTSNDRIFDAGTA